MHNNPNAYVKGCLKFQINLKLYYANSFIVVLNDGFQRTMENSVCIQTSCFLFYSYFIILLLFNVFL